MEEENTAEILVMGQKLEAAESQLTEKDRELANAQEKVASLSDDLVASQGKVRHRDRAGLLTVQISYFLDCIAA